jgi:hypothetical protein
MQKKTPPVRFLRQLLCLARQTGHSVEVCETGSANDPTTDDLGKPLHHESISSPNQALEERVLSLEQQMHVLQTTERKEETKEARATEEKRTASSINEDGADALELSIA